MRMNSRIKEFYLRRQSDRDLALRIFYTGASMFPTLRTGDVLYVRPLNRQAIRCGDVAVFVPDADSPLVVHRIVSRTEAGFVSMGDNNESPDSQLLRKRDVIGRVFLAENRGKFRRIHGGVVGRLAGFLRRLRSATERTLSDSFRPVYRFLTRSRVLHEFGRVMLQTKVVSFNRQSGDRELKLMWNGRMIGRLSGTGPWIIKRPFRLLVDEKTLPTLNEPERVP
jgi:signal peptidase I